MIVLVCQCGSTRTASGGSAGTLVPGATQRCGKCPRWCPGGSWTVEHRPMVPPAGRKGLERHLGASQSLPGPESADSRTRQPPHGTRSALDGVQVARGRPNTHRWSPRGGREGLRAPSGASQGVQRLSCPGVHRVVPFAGNAARGGRRFGGTAGEEKALTWGFSVVDPESGTIDLAPTAVWVNDR